MVGFKENIVGIVFFTALQKQQGHEHQGQAEQEFAGQRCHGKSLV